MTTTAHNRDVILNSDVIVLATKPQQILDITTEIQASISDSQSQTHLQPYTASAKNWRPLIVSVAASITISDLEEKVCACPGVKGVCECPVVFIRDFCGI